MWGTSSQGDIGGGTGSPWEPSARGLGSGAWKGPLLCRGNVQDVLGPGTQRVAAHILKGTLRVLSDACLRLNLQLNRKHSGKSGYRIYPEPCMLASFLRLPRWFSRSVIVIAGAPRWTETEIFMRRCGKWNDRGVRAGLPRVRARPRVQPGAGGAGGRGCRIRQERRAEKRRPFKGRGLSQCAGSPSDTHL